MNLDRFDQLAAKLMYAGDRRVPAPEYARHRRIVLQSQNPTGVRHPLRLKHAVWHAKMRGVSPRLLTS
jgi:hypothetical protein